MAKAIYSVDRVSDSGLVGIDFPGVAVKHIGTFGSKDLGDAGFKKCCRIESEETTS